MNNNYPVSLALDYLLRDLRISFNKSDEVLVKWVRDNYLTGEWDRRILLNYHAFRYCNQRYGITKNAIKLVKILKECENLDLFPVIERTYAGTHQLSGGAWSWVVYGKDNDYTNYGSSEKVSDFFNKKYKIVCGEGFGFGMCELIVEKYFNK
jgi:hypothetical protein